MHPVNNQTASCAIPTPRTISPLCNPPPFLHPTENECVFSFYNNFNLVVVGWGTFPTRGLHFSCLARGAFFTHHFAFPRSVKYRPAKYNTDPIGYYLQLLILITLGGSAECVERWQTNYGSDFLFHIFQLWFQNLLALVARYQEFTFCPRFAVCMHSWIVEMWVCQT